MFQLDKHDVKIKHLNLRTEKHGDQDVAAADFTINLKASALLLDTIDKKLRKVFFEKPAKGEQQALPIDGNNLTALAVPYLREQKLDQKFDGYEVEFASLLEQIEPLFFADVKVTLLKATFIEGGSVELALKVSMTIDEEDDAPLLSVWRRGEIKLTLTPPEKQDASSEGDILAQQDAEAAAAEAKRLTEKGKQAA
jgi:hypothetical protein